MQEERAVDVDIYAYVDVPVHFVYVLLLRDRRFAFDEAPPRMICPRCGFNLRLGRGCQR